MRFFASIIIISIFALIAGLFLPWWSIALIAFGVSLLLPQMPVSAFLSGFLGIFLLWIILASFINASNAGILAGRVGELLGLGHNPVLLILVTAVTGGLVGGMAALSASYLRVHKA